jgi:hypothetical protein
MVVLAGCVGFEPPPARFSAIPRASDEECAIVRTALGAVLNEEPYYAKPLPPPPISYIAISPHLAADAFGENPYEALKDVAPVNLSHCVGASITGPRARIIGFDYPERLRNDRIVDAHGWVSRPIVQDGKATVLLNRGQCWRTSTIELVREGADWRAAAIRHSPDDIVWSGRHPCEPWL